MSADTAAVLFWGAVLLAMAIWSVRKLRGMNRQAEAKRQWRPEWWRAFPKQPVLLSDEPDVPQPLGSEIAWLAVRCEDPERGGHTVCTPSTVSCRGTTTGGAMASGT